MILLLILCRDIDDRDDNETQEQKLQTQSNNNICFIMCTDFTGLLSLAIGMQFNKFFKMETKYKQKRLPLYTFFNIIT